MANSAISSWVKMVYVGKLVHPASTIRLSVQSFYINQYKATNVNHSIAKSQLAAEFGPAQPQLVSFLLPWGNKVNSFSNQLKLSWVCKLECSLTKNGATVIVINHPSFSLFPLFPSISYTGPVLVRTAIQYNPIPINQVWAVPIMPIITIHYNLNWKS